jgi:hypothetical protein
MGLHGLLQGELSTLTFCRKLISADFSYCQTFAIMTQLSHLYIKTELAIILQNFNGVSLRNFLSIVLKIIPQTDWNFANLFLSFSRKMTEQYLILGHKNFPSHRFKFIIQRGGKHMGFLLESQKKRNRWEGQEVDGRIILNGP